MSGCSSSTAPWHVRATTQGSQTVSGGGIRTSSQLVCGDVCSTFFSWTVGLGFGVAAHWVSWADCLPVIDARHPHVAAELLEQLEGTPIRLAFRKQPPQRDHLLASWGSNHHHGEQ